MSDALSYSGMYLANKCRQAYWYKYRDKVKPKSSTMHFEAWERMYRGILIHGYLEALFLGQDGAAAMADKVAEDRARSPFTAEMEDALSYMLDNSAAVAETAAEWLPASDWAPYIHNGKPMVEAELRHPLPGWPGGFVGYADLVAVHKPTGRVLVLDYKTRERFEAEGADQYNRQFALYQYVLNQMGIPCTGSVLFEMKPEPPKRAARIQRIDEGGIDSTRVSTDGRFRLIPTFRSKTYLENLWADTVKEAAVIAGLKEQEKYRSMSSFNCSKCEYERLCQAELGGHDVQYVLQQFYNVPQSLTVIMEE